MPKNRKRKRQSLPLRPEDASMILFGDVVDLAAAMAAHEIDAAADRRWLAKHPDAEMRRRMATRREEAACGLPPGCYVIVKRGPAGSQIRMIFPPM